MWPTWWNAKKYDVKKGLEHHCAYVTDKIKREFYVMTYLLYFVYIFAKLNHDLLIFAATMRGSDFENECYPISKEILTKLSQNPSYKIFEVCCLCDLPHC